jgi:uncharacterized protein (TIGR02444 family)
MSAQPPSARDSAWDFALTVYGRPGARAACLALQDRAGADAVALLALLHCAACGAGALSRDRIAAALAAAAPWRAAAVLPLRAVRRGLKGLRFAGGDAVESVRRRVAEAELLAERIALDRLVAVLRPVGAGGADRCADEGARLLALYCAVAGIAADAENRGHLAALLAAAFPDAAGRAAALVDAACGG